MNSTNLCLSGNLRKLPKSALRHPLNNADDTTPYVCRQNYAEVIEFSELTINKIFAWFKNNGLAANSSKSHFLVSRYEKISLKILVKNF